MRDPFKPLDAPDPAGTMSKCPQCKGTLKDPNVTECPNCHSVFSKPMVGGPYLHLRDQKKQKPNNFNIPLSSDDSNITIAGKDKKPERVKDDYVSDEFKQCIDKPLPRIKRKKNRYVDNKLDDVSKSCTDLAIDG